MANTSIQQGISRLWQHILALNGKKVDTDLKNIDNDVLKEKMQEAGISQIEIHIWEEND